MNIGDMVLFNFCEGRVLKIANDKCIIYSPQLEKEVPYIVCSVADCIVLESEATK